MGLEGKCGADKEAGRRGLAECKKEMGAYDACMAKFMKGKKVDEKLFRVKKYQKHIKTNFETIIM